MILEKISRIIISGGFKETRDIQGNAVIYNVSEVLTEEERTKPIPNLPDKMFEQSMVMHDGKILICGGNDDRKCFVLEQGTWKEHSTLNMKRDCHSTVTTQNATFLFGGLYSRATYEYLPKGSKTWILGKTEIPDGVCFGSAVAVKSEQEIWLIGDNMTNFSKRILSFNINDHTFRILPFKSKMSRNDHRCATIPHTNKVMITGGYNFDILNSTEIIDTETGEVTLASPMNTKRAWHGIGILTIKGEDRVAVFGGVDGIRLDSVESYNTKTGKWEISNVKLKKPKSNFSFLTVKLSDIISKP